MKTHSLTLTDMEKLLHFLAAEQNMDYDEFIEKIEAQMLEKEEKLNYLAKEMSNLSNMDRKILLEKINAEGCSGLSQKSHEIRHQREASPAYLPEANPVKTCDFSSPIINTETAPSSKIFPLSYFMGMSIADLTHTKPELLIINGESMKISSWKDLSIAFVRYLFSKKDLTMDHLPLCPNPRSSKAFVNFIPAQPPGSGKSGLFEKLSDQVYVDIKYNAKYHLLNIWQTLDFLGLRSKYDIKIAMRQ